MPYLNLSKAVPWVQDCYGRNHSTAPAGRGLRRSLAQSPAQAGSALSSDRVTQGFIQLGLKKFQGWRGCSLFGQPAPGLSYPHSKAVFPYQSESLSLQLISIFSHHPVMCWCKEPGSFSTLFYRPSRHSIQTLEKEN